MFVLTQAWRYDGDGDLTIALPENTWESLGEYVLTYQVSTSTVTRCLPTLRYQALEMIPSYPLGEGW